jgi:hypothetical protein
MKFDEVNGFGLLTSKEKELLFTNWTSAACDKTRELRGTS